MADAALGAGDIRTVEAPGLGCCPTGPAATSALDGAGAQAAAERWARPAGDGLARVDLMAPDVHCGACISTIERGLAKTPGVESARVNLSLRRVAVVFREGESSVASILERLTGLGYVAKPFDADAVDALRKDPDGRELLACLAVAGFGAANIMLFSVSVWSGAEDATRDLLHSISGLIAIPIVAFAGRPFFRSALRALRAWRLNMDVPISLAVILAIGVSVYETANSGEHAYFDASVTLLFFLLIGRYLDHRARGMARSAAAELTALRSRAATRISADGARVAVAIEELQVDDIVEVAAGERVPADGVIAEGRSDLDRSMVTGESAPEPAGPGDLAHAGMMNLTGPLRLRVTAVAEETLLADISRMISAAETGKNRYTRLADRAAQIYAPAIHIISALAFGGWLFATGDLRHAVLIAAATLIVTCPCALGLAVPVTQAVAGGALFRAGVLLKDGAALEKLAEVDTIAFDKTGTLTLGALELTEAPAPDHALWPVAAALASGSRHPLSRAVATAFEGATAKLSEIAEVPGCGVEGLWTAPDGRARRVRLGRAGWCGAPETTDSAGPEVWLAVEQESPLRFGFRDLLREDAAEVVAAARSMGLDVILLSGDRPSAAEAAARDAGIENVAAGLSPAEKLTRLEALAADGRKVLMVGDGINDAPALATAYASMSPVDAAEVSQAAAGLVFFGDRLDPVLIALRTARGARARALENFGVAAVYNMIAIPFAVAGYVSPLVAALAMSGSSIVVTLNALRLRFAEGARR